VTGCPACNKEHQRKQLELKGLTLKELRRKELTLRELKDKKLELQELEKRVECQARENARERKELEQKELSSS
jgi:hypothetical protein